MKLCRDTQCPSAGKPMDSGAFYVDRSKPDGLCPICGPCSRRRQRESRIRCERLRVAQEGAWAALRRLFDVIDAYEAEIDAQLAELDALEAAE